MYLGNNKDLMEMSNLRHPELITTTWKSEFSIWTSRLFYCMESKLRKLPQPLPKVQLFLNSHLSRIINVCWVDTIDNNLLWWRTNQMLKMGKTYNAEIIELYHKVSPILEPSNLKEKKRPMNTLRREL